MAYVEHTFTDVPDFLRQVIPYSDLWWIYRGQVDATWKLIPKAGRAEYFCPSWEEKRSRSGMTNELPADLYAFNTWRKEASAFSRTIPEKDFECLAYAEHYGLATRLLDWSLNPLVALYFAAETDFDRDGAVYCYLAQLGVSEEFRNLQTVPGVARYDVRPFDRRFEAQDAVFTVHPKPQEPLLPEPAPPQYKEYAPDGVNLVRFLVRSRAKPPILDQLSAIGVHRKRLFPDLDGLSDFLNWQTRRFVKSRSKPIE